MKRPLTSLQARRSSMLGGLAKEIRKAMPDFETLAQANAENQIRIMRLKRTGHQQGQSACLKLADRLADCHDSPCGSMACFRCSRWRRLQLLSQWLPYFMDSPDYVAVTLVFYQDMLSNNQLLGWTPDLLKQRLRKQLARIGFDQPIIGGFEMDYHRYTQKPGESYWMPHFHLLIPNDVDKLEKLRLYMKRAKNLYQRKGTKNRPMRQDPLVNVVPALTYCFKGIWSEIPHFINGDGKLKKGGKRRIGDPVFARSLVKLDRLKNSQLTFTLNVQK